MERRTKILLYTAIGMGGAYLLWLVGVRPILDDVESADGRISAAKKALNVEKSYLRRQKAIEKKWDDTMEAVDSPGRATLADQFDLYVRDLMDRTIGSKSRLPTISPVNSRDQKGDFLETAVEVKNARFKPDEWIRFLTELANENDFLKLRRLSLKSRFDRPEKVLVVDMKLSTIEYAPGNGKTKWPITWSDRFEGPSRKNLPKMKVGDIRIVADRNIFSPFKAKPKKTTPRKTTTKPPSTPPAPDPVVRGFVQLADGYRVLVYDPARRDETFLKIGDNIQGAEILRVDLEKAVLKIDEVEKEFFVGSEIPRTDGVTMKGASPAKGNTSSNKPTGRSERMEKLRQKMREKYGKKVEEEEEPE
jgi:hypothetical protein